MKVTILDQEPVANTANGNPRWQLLFDSADLECPMVGYTKADAGWTLEYTDFIGEAEIDGYYTKTGRFIIAGYKKIK